MSGAEDQLRQEVAACTLLLNDEGLMGYSGHVSARLPGGDTFLVQPIDVSRAGLSPDDLLVCDFDGKVLRGRQGMRPPAEVFLHGEILRARPDVNSVAHFHHDLTNVFTLVEGASLTPIKNHAIRWRSGIPVHPDPSHVSDSGLGRAVADTLGPHHALQIRAHGQVVVAESVRAVLIDSVHFVENAVTMYHAAALGRVLPLTDADMDAFARAFKRAPHISKLWTYYVGRGRAKGFIPADWAID
ncbi:MAG: ribulose-5-phosphate 4-epimerase-like epimerase or aldolase [Hyphomicrobiales bacterium]|nr:ribulose-5-phosphate 4-epimerase-like epimerase or aldolase [Hyphomicrobiales bacterium]